ncbi:MFS transporter [Peribacillus sp. NPDC097295]|uniref:MFS transporter n=1 Tax=Peribacillus sp. NPDC097295 TaxID=3364402 RepID=UPI00382A490F
MDEIIKLFKNRNYTKLFLANVTSQMGGTIGMTAFMFYLLDRFTNQPMYATITELMYSLPTLAVFLLVGVFADRLDRQKVALYCDWICAGLSVLFLLSLEQELLMVSFAIIFLRSAVRNFFVPAEAALIQGILLKEDYTMAAGLNQMVSSLFMLFGNGIGIFIYWSVGIEGAIIFDVIGFIISGFLIRSCRITQEIRQPNGVYHLKELSVTGVWADFKIGWQYIWQYKLLFTLISGFLVFGIVNGGFSVMQVFILKYKLEPVDYEKYSVILGVIFGVGILLGSILASMLAKKMKLHHMMVVGLLISGVGTVAAGLVETTLQYMIGLAIVALSLPILNVSLGGWLPSLVAPEMMGRVQGWINPLVMLSQSITLFLIALGFPAYISVETLYWVVGGSLLFVGFLYMTIIPKFIHEKAPEADVMMQASK